MRVDCYSDYRKVDKVLVDDVDVTKRCFWADDVTGEAGCYKLKDGRPYIKRNEAATEILRGKVTIIMK